LVGLVPPGEINLNYGMVLTMTLSVVFLVFVVRWHILARIEKLRYWNTPR